MPRWTFTDESFKNQFIKLFEEETIIYKNKKLIDYIFDDYYGDYSKELHTFITELINIKVNPEKLDEYLFNNYQPCDDVDKCPKCHPDNPYIDLDSDEELEDECTDHNWVRCPVDGAGFCDIHDDKNLDLNWLHQFDLPGSLQKKYSTGLVRTKFKDLQDELYIKNISKLVYGNEDATIENPVKNEDGNYVCDWGRITYYSSDCSKWEISHSTVIKSIKIVLRYIGIPEELLKLIN